MPVQALAVAFIGLVVLALSGMEFWMVKTARSTELREAQVTTSNLARSMAQQAADAIGEADSLLDGILERLETEGIAISGSQRMLSFLKRRVLANPQLHGIFIYAHDGTWLATSLDKSPRANNSDREYFQYHRTHEDPRLYIGKVIASRSTGELVIPVSRRINAPDGSFAGVLLATVRVEYFRQFYQSFDVDKSGVIVLTLADGTLLVNRAHEDMQIGTDLSSNRIFSELLPHNATGTATFRSVVDGVLRIHSYERVSGYPLVVIAALSQDGVLAPWRQSVVRSVAVVGVFGFFALMFGLALIHQIRALAQAEERLRHTHDALEALAMQDGLTGLANRRQFDAVLPLEVARARRGGRPLGTILLDIDHFKRYNDRYGHLAGDQCIKAVAAVIRACLRRPADIAARYGGEEFVILLPDTDRAGAWKVADDIVRSVRALRLVHEDNDSGFVTTSAGVHAGVPGAEEEAAKNCVGAADKALYEAKATGRNRVCVSGADT